VAKNGSREWYKAKFEDAQKESDKASAALADALAKVVSLEAQLKEGGLRVDTSLLSPRRLSGVNTFLHKAKRYTDKETGHIVAACLADMAEGSRRVAVQGLIARLKRMNGMGLR